MSTPETPDQKTYFPKQNRNVPSSKLPFSKQDQNNGAPFAPLPRSFINVDARLGVCQPVAGEKEKEFVSALRTEFQLKGFENIPYTDDIVRAFRIITEKSCYLEIGTFDRGNLAYASTLLKDDALLIGVDIQDEEKQDSLLRKKLKPKQTYIPISGNSRSKETLEAVKEALGGKKVDVIFIDGDHTAYGAMSDYANFESLVSNDGIILFHDSVWEGNQKHKGVADALDEISRVEPVYLIDGRNPCRVFSRPLWRAEFWGCVGVIFASDQKWRGNAR